MTAWNAERSTETNGYHSVKQNRILHLMQVMLHEMQELENKMSTAK